LPSPGLVVAVDVVLHDPTLSQYIAVGTMILIAYLTEIYSKLTISR
jgi:hypothetical protein